MTTTPKNDGWLDQEIKAGEKEMKRWPEWMRLAARFEPFGRADDADSQ